MTSSLSPTDTARRGRLSLLAQASPDRLAELIGEALPELPRHEMLRPAETGTMLLRGRIGGTGSAFNFGEMTVTRASLRLLGCGTAGHAMVQGRDRLHATRAALLDALMQTAAAPGLERAVLDPLRREAQARRQDRAERAAATRVEFFTMVRGEDQ